MQTMGAALLDGDLQSLDGKNAGAERDNDNIYETAKSPGREAQGRRSEESGTKWRCHGDLTKCHACRRVTTDKVDKIPDQEIKHYGPWRQKRHETRGQGDVQAVLWPARICTIPEADSAYAERKPFGRCVCSRYDDPQAGQSRTNFSSLKPIHTIREAVQVIPETPGGLAGRVDYPGVFEQVWPGLPVAYQGQTRNPLGCGKARLRGATKGLITGRREALRKMPATGKTRDGICCSTERRRFWTDSDLKTAWLLPVSGEQCALCESPFCEPDEIPAGLQG